MCGAGGRLLALGLMLRNPLRTLNRPNGNRRIQSAAWDRGRSAEMPLVRSATGTADTPVVRVPVIPHIGSLFSGRASPHLTLRFWMPGMVTEAGSSIPRTPTSATRCAHRPAIRRWRLPSVRLFFHTRHLNAGHLVLNVSPGGAVFSCLPQ